MSEINSKLKEENGLIKGFFDFNVENTQLKHLKEVFTNYIRNSKNDPKYFISFFDFYTWCRPNQHSVSKALLECIYSCFPEQINEIQQDIKSKFLKYIIFPEEFPIKPYKEQSEMFLLLQKDAIDEFISFLSNNPTIDVTKEQELDGLGHYHYLFDLYRISLIDFCCFFGSLKCFKYLLLNKCEVTKETLKYSIAGGNQEIINILKEKGHSFEECLETSVEYHRYELTNWLNENYKCKPFPLLNITDMNSQIG